jgi:branched-chain amino acid transport system permease protein
MDTARLKNWNHTVWLLILGSTLLFLSFFIKTSYHFLILNIIGLNAMIAVGLNLLVGYAGQISMGHAAFFGIGAYVSAIVTTKIDLYPVYFSWLPEWFLPWVIVVLAMLCTGLIAYLVGIPTMKLKGNYLVMATLGFNIILEIVLVEWDSLTGGSNGMTGVHPLRIGSFSFDSDIKFYYLIWGLTFLTVIAALNLIESRVGRALKAIHGSEVAANSLGINIQKYKVKVFVLSAMIASLAGSMYAHYITVITPKSCDVLYSIQLVTMVIIGGLGKIWGALFGAALLTLLSETLHVMEKFNVVVMGLILILVMMFFPSGLLPGLAELVKGKRES